MLTDADGDGKRLLRLYHFGPGDSVEFQTHVSIARIPDGTYVMSASAPAQASLPNGATLRN